jgi:hypothetical protein
MTLEEVLLKALELGPGNPREITERLVNRVRDTLNTMADREEISRVGYPGKGNEKRYSLKRPSQVILRRI